MNITTTLVSLLIFSLAMGLLISGYVDVYSTYRPEGSNTSSKAFQTFNQSFYNVQNEMEGVKTATMRTAAANPLLGYFDAALAVFGIIKVIIVTPQMLIDLIHLAETTSGGVSMMPFGIPPSVISFLIGISLVILILAVAKAALGRWEI